MRAPLLTIALLFSVTLPAQVQMSAEDAQDVELLYAQAIFFQQF